MEKENSQDTKKTKKRPSNWNRRIFCLNRRKI